MEGTQGIIMKLSGSLWKEKVDMSILFDPSQNDYPIAWERILTRNKDVKQVYVVTDLEKITVAGASIPYPKKATLIQYNGLNPETISTILVDHVSINQPEPDLFTINPQQATHIYDVDKKTMIEIP